MKEDNELHGVDQGSNEHSFRVSSELHWQELSISKKACHASIWLFCLLVIRGVPIEENQIDPILILYV